MRAWLDRMYRLVLSVTILLMVLGPASVPARASREIGSQFERVVQPPVLPDSIPSPPTGGPRPTIVVTPDHGYAGQSVTVSGQGVPPYPGVRVAWLTGDATLTAAVVDLDPSDAYSATLTVPTEASTGLARICAAVTGTALAEFACVDFTVDTPPPGSIQGQLPLTATATLFSLAPRQFDASFILRSSSGMEVASVPIQQDGSFEIAQVPPGTYVGTVEGSVPILVGNTEVTVGPSQIKQLYPPPLEEWLGTQPSPGGRTCNPPADTSAHTTVWANVVVSPTGTYLALGPAGPAAPAVTVTIAALPQPLSDTAVVSVTFVVRREDGSEIVIGTDTDSADGWQILYNASLLPDDAEWLMVKPLPASGCGAWGATELTVLPNPLADPSITAGQIVWNSDQQRYDFGGTMSRDLFSVVYPDPPPSLPLLGELENRLAAGIRFEGSLGLDGTVSLRLLEADALVRLLRINVYDRSQHLFDPDEDHVIATGPCQLCVGDWWDAGYRFGPHTLASFSHDVPVFNAPLATFWGIVTVHASIRVGVSGSLSIEGTLSPLTPQLEAVLAPSLGPSLSVSLWVDILLGVVSAGADATASFEVGLPMHANSRYTPTAWLGDPFLRIRVHLSLWARVNLWFWKKRWNLSSYELVNYTIHDARSSAAGAAQADEQSPPRVMAAPAVASGPGGEMLSVYIEDTTPELITPTMQVMARFWVTQTNGWGDPVPLTDGSHAAMDPGAAFVGSDGHALAAWTENTMTQAEDEAAGDDLEAILARQEVIYSYWNGQNWSASQQLTDNDLPDGRNSLAGDVQGATLAWVQDTDGKVSTRADWGIAVTHWNTATVQWGPVELLDAATAVNGTRQALLPSSEGTTPAIRTENDTIAFPSAPAADLRVCPAGPPACDYADVQTAVDTANPGDVLKIAAGTYTGVQTRAGVTQMVYVSKTVTIRGGYTAGNWTTPDPAANPTILDAEGQGRVIYITGSISPTIAGLCITGGDASGLHGHPYLGRDAGGGVYVYQATAIISANQVFGNVAQYGGIYLLNSDTALIGNTVSSNTVSFDGGGVYLYDSDDATLIDNSIISNTATLQGGGLGLVYSDAALSGNTVTLNVSDKGGGVLLSESGATLDSNVVISNTASLGGGLYLYSSNATLVNNVVADNRASSSGCGLYISDSSPHLFHTTIARNSGGDGRGVYVTNLTGSSSAVLTNTILTNHYVGIAATPGNEATLDVVLGYNAINTEGAVSVDRWVAGVLGFAVDGYHLTSGSAAIDQGSPTGVATDIDGDLRPQGTAPDLGADELPVTAPGSCYAQVSSMPGITYTTVQAAVDVADEGDVVKVAGYCAGVQARAGVTQTVYISKNITLRGGYTVTNWTTSDPDTNPTTLDAQGQGRVLYVAGDVSPTIEGMHITGGNAANLWGGAYANDAGGGVYVITATAMISGNYVLGNTAMIGGGLYLQNSPGVLFNNIVTGNTAGAGGGVYLAGSTAMLMYNTISGNYADDGGGGLWLTSSPATLMGNLVISNSTQTVGGGLGLDNSSATLTSNTVVDNAAGFGGGIWLSGGAARLSGNLIASNTAQIQGGGLELSYSDAAFDGDTISNNQSGGVYLYRSGATFTNTVIADNQGPGIAIDRSSPLFLHATIARNTGEGVYITTDDIMVPSVATLKNTILVSHTVGVAVTSYNSAILDGVLWYGNTTNTDSSGGPATVAVTHAYTGTPAFAVDGYHLTAGSAAVERGIDAGVTTDIDGHPRPQDAAPDLGADEYGACYTQVSSQPGVTYPTVQAAVDAADEGDTVKVAGFCAGVWVRDGLTQTVYVSKTINIRGGYAATDWTVSDPVANPTTLDAQDQGRVLYIRGNVSATVEGLHLTGGNAEELGGAPWGWDAGGGVYAIDASVVFSNNQVFSNTAFLGGGTALFSSTAAFDGNAITSNRAGYVGGVYLYESNGVFSSNAVSHNVADHRGGGVLLGGGNVTLRENTIFANIADLGGGLALEGSDATVINNVLGENHAHSAGSGLAVWGASPHLLHNTLARNTGSSGIYVTWDDWTGTTSNVTLTNTILVSHSVGISVTSGNTVTADAILWFGTPITVSQATAAAVNVQNQYTGDPAFAADGYHLTVHSPAVDRGVDAGVPVDIDGDSRPQQAAPDLGADERVGWMNAQVSAARHDGQILLVWTTDEDGELTTNGDRRLAVANVISNTWSIHLPEELPAGADSPSAAFRGEDELHVAFLVRGNDDDGVTDTGIGNQAALWTAQSTASGWTAAPVLAELGQTVHAEQPRLSGGGSEMLLLFRRFGGAETNGYLGQLALSQISAQAASAPLYLTDDPSQHWQPALAVNQVTGQAGVLNVRRAALGPSASLLAASQLELALASTAARPAFKAVTLVQADDPVESLTIEPTPDPALDPDLGLSQRHATPGSTVVVTATVRNVGRGTASGLSVSLYSGTPTSGTLLTPVTLPYTLTFNDSLAITFVVTTTSGEQPIYAELTTTGDDAHSGNNIAAASLGELPPPTLVNVVASTRYPNALEVSWMPPAVEGVAGYRILRSGTPGGPYELVGEAEGLAYSDLLLETNQPYHYVVEAYDADGVRSSPSVEASGMLPLSGLCLPLVMRNDSTR